MLSGGGTVSSVLTLDQSNGFELFTLPSTFANLTSATFTSDTIANDGNFSIDEVSVVVSSIPEPSGLVALLVASAVLGFRRKRFCYPCGRSLA